MYRSILVLTHTPFWYLIFIHRFKLLLTDSDGGAEGGDSEAVIKTKAFEKGVLALPGTHFLPNGRATPYVRASFSLTGEEDVDRAVQRIREAILDARAEANGIKANGNGAAAAV